MISNMAHHFEELQCACMSACSCGTSIRQFAAVIYGISIYVNICLYRLNCSIILTLNMNHPVNARIWSKKVQYIVWYLISTITSDIDDKYQYVKLFTSSSEGFHDRSNFFIAFHPRSFTFGLFVLFEGLYAQPTRLCATLDS